MFRVAVRKFGPFESAIARQWQAFENEAGTGLRLEAVPMELEILFEAIMRKDTSPGWDVAFVNTDWIAAANRNDALCDLASRVRDDPPQDYPFGWTRSLLCLQAVDGRILGLPYHDGPECLIVRKDLFDKARLKVPETWHEFRETARLLNDPAGRRYGTVFACYPDGHNTVYDFCLQVWTRGGEFIDENGHFAFNSQEVYEALTFLREVVNDASMTHPSCREFDSVKSGLAFAAGEAAMMVNWFGFAAMAETVADSSVKGSVTIAPVPHLPGTRGVSLNTYWILSIPSTAIHKESAWRFLRHCATASMDKLLTLEGGIGCRRSTWLDPEVNRVVPFYRDMEKLHAEAREMPRLEQWPKVAAVVDRMVLAAINTVDEIEHIAARGQAEADRLGVAS